MSRGGEATGGFRKVGDPKTRPPKNREKLRKGQIDQMPDYLNKAGSVCATDAKSLWKLPFQLLLSLYSSSSHLQRPSAPNSKANQSLEHQRGWQPSLYTGVSGVLQTQQWRIKSWKIHDNYKLKINKQPRLRIVCILFNLWEHEHSNTQNLTCSTHHSTNTLSKDNLSWKFSWWKQKIVKVLHQHTSDTKPESVQSDVLPIFLLRPVTWYQSIWEVQQMVWGDYLDKCLREKYLILMQISSRDREKKKERKKNNNQPKSSPVAAASLQPASRSSLPYGRKH